MSATLDDLPNSDWNKQIQVLVDLGYSVSDAEQSIRWVRQNSLGAGLKWVPDSEALDDMDDSKATLDAQLSFKAPPEYKRILYAKSGI